jgi:hypothetical protein
VTDDSYIESKLEAATSEIDSVAVLLRICCDTFGVD